MADIALISPGVNDAPEGYSVPGAQEIILKSITATYDGTAAAGPFIPTLQILAPNGAVLAACPTSTALVAGASADVSWFPRGSVGTGGGGGGGIQFNTDNEGGYLDITTNNADPDHFGIKLQDEEDNDVLIDTDARLLLNTEQNGNVVMGTAAHGAGGGGSVLIGVQTGQSLSVLDNTDSPIFEVDAPAAVTAFAPLKVDGPTGATAATRFGGGTLSGAPTSGSWLTGDFVSDHSGKMWVCTAGGSPGTWADVGASGGGTITDITSTDSSVTVTGPTGPTADLAVADSPAVGGVTITGTPAVGDVPIASGGTAAVWGVPPSATGVAFDTNNVGGYLDVEGNSAGPDTYTIHLKDSGGGGINLEDTVGSASLLIESGSVSIVTGNGSSFAVTGHLGAELFAANDDGSATIVAGTKLALYNPSSPVAQPAAIPAPTGGAVVDTQARAAIALILSALGAAAGGIGVTA